MFFAPVAKGFPSYGPSVRYSLGLALLGVSSEERMERTLPLGDSVADFVSELTREDSFSAAP